MNNNGNVVSFCSKFALSQRRKVRITLYYRSEMKWSGWWESNPRLYMVCSYSLDRCEVSSISSGACDRAWRCGCADAKPHLLTGLTVPPRRCHSLNQNWISFPNWIKLNCFWFISVQFSAGSTKTLLSLEYARLCISMNGDETRRFSRRREMVRTAGFEPTERPFRVSTFSFIWVHY